MEDSVQRMYPEINKVDWLCEDSEIILYLIKKNSISRNQERCSFFVYFVLQLQQNVSQNLFHFLFIFLAQIAGNIYGSLYFIYLKDI